MKFLQKYVFIPLDIFRENQQNKGMDISRRREAWLTLFSCDDPETIIQLIEKYPEFRGIYQEGYQICLNMERVMNMFSEELYELDRNTVQYMIDVMQEKINEQEKEREKEREKALLGTVSLLRSLNMPETDIIQKIRELYELTEEQAKTYLIK